MDRTSTILRLLPLALVALLSLRAQAAADDAAKPDSAERAEAAPAPAAKLGDGRLIRVRLPLTITGATDAKVAIKRAVIELNRSSKKNGRRPTLILELSPQQGGTGEGTAFTDALS